MQAAQPRRSRPRRWPRACCSKASARSASSSAAAARSAGARAGAEVILAGGAINSPQLLQLSGVGPPRAAARARHPGRRRPARRRRGPAGPFPGADRAQLHQAHHLQRRHRLADAPARRRHALRAAGASGPLTSAPATPAPSSAPTARVATPDMQIHFITFSADRMGERAASLPRLHRIGLPASPGEPRLRAASRARTRPLRPRSSRATSRPRPTGAPMSRD